MSLSRITETTWLTSDGQSWTDWHEARAHEQFITLRVRVEYLLRCAIGPDAFTKALLDTPGLYLVTGKGKPQRNPP